MKAKSASVQNFQHLVKEMIDGTRETDDDGIQFHRMIYEKWRFESITVPKRTECEGGNDAKPLEWEQQEISATIAHRRFRRTKCKRLAGNVDEQQRITMQSVSQLPHANDTKETVKQVNDGNSTVPTEKDSAVNIVEIWNSALKQAKQPPSPEKKNENIHEEKQIAEKSVKDARSEEKLSFEAWKRKKTMAYQQLFAKIESERQQKVMEKIARMESRKMQTQLLEKEQQKNERRQRLINKKQIEMIKHENRTLHRMNRDENQTQKNEEHWVHCPTNTVRAKNTPADKKIHPMRTSSNRNVNRRNKTPPMNDNVERITFNSLLNQLNWTLHKKYERERRHLVQSYYCQPCYYGNGNCYAL